MNTKEFTLYELSHLACYRSAENGTSISVASLTAAKTRAAKDQCFQGTVLMIEDEHGDLVAQKKYGERWVKPGHGWLGNNF